ncbi:hypothetical protein NBRC10512_005880 [Rhodotorula toruloides]|uniref:RHTO0S10e00386g1_1 n=2 Tax=Rhodotorula toruloides TaxID=5286 RepID=A0A061BCU7_RHOTO|nr:FMN binding oxidoreductase [Rhodotorula toruloides NP11]EMS18551.1 FMN binding oxidoreductase [Rhodotorula toruloides NP11]CDR44782.1 RHTO0S10e00386g1_1 [Rhodotorula toruloides]
MPSKLDLEHIAAIAQPAQLPCGLTLSNRLVKAAMEEMLSNGDGLPSELDEALYEIWAEGGYGMLISGNVQVSPKHLGTPLDIYVPSSPSPSTSAAFSRWAQSMRPLSDAPRPLAIMQLNHPGRQSMRLFCGRPASQPSLAPSAVPMAVGPNILGYAVGRLVWGTPEEMTATDFDEVVEQFVAGARLAKETGWDGVELHASHGYLLAQVMSPKANLRTDAYGGTARKRLTLLFRIVDAIRAELPQKRGFCVGVKLNCSDFIKGGLTEQDALDNIKWIAEHGGIDFIEISGGTYENPEFMNPDVSLRPSTLLREAFFDAFAHRARWLLSTLPPSSLPSPAPLVLLTGGLRSRAGIARALSSSTKSPPAADLVGLGRPAAADPFLPHKLLRKTVPGDMARPPSYDSLAGVRWIRFLFGWLAVAGPGLDVFYHTMLLRQIALARMKEKRRVERLNGPRKGDGTPTKVVRTGVEGEDLPLSNFWVLGWRVWVAPLVPAWMLGLAGALVFAVLGRGWKWAA